MRGEGSRDLSSSHSDQVIGNHNTSDEEIRFRDSALDLKTHYEYIEDRVH